MIPVRALPAPPALVRGTLREGCPHRDSPPRRGGTGGELTTAPLALVRGTLREGATGVGGSVSPLIPVRALPAPLAFVRGTLREGCPHRDSPPRRGGTGGELATAPPALVRGTLQEGATGVGGG
jgi:hypothetical protein